MSNFTKLVIPTILLLATTSSTKGSVSNLVSRGTLALNDVTCGGRIVATSGEITYKPFDVVEPNERCVWILRTNSATSATVTMTSLETPSSVSVLALGLKDRREEWAPYQAGDSKTLAYANVLVVTFHTGNCSTGLGKGFTLSYRFNTTGNNIKASTRSMDYINIEDIGYIKNPAGNTSYDNNELSTFVFTPYFNRFDAANKIKVVYVKYALEAGHDYVQVYTFDKSWKMLGKVTDEVEAISNSDLIMLVFQSDGSVVSSGFHLTYAQSSKCVCPVNENENGVERDTNP